MPFMCVRNLPVSFQLQPKENRFRSLQHNKYSVFNSLISIFMLHGSCKSITLRRLKSLYITIKINSPLHEPKIINSTTMSTLSHIIDLYKKMKKCVNQKLSLSFSVAPGFHNRLQVNQVSVQWLSAIFTQSLIRPPFKTSLLNCNKIFYITTIFSILLFINHIIATNLNTKSIKFI